MTCGVTGDQEHKVWHPGVVRLVPDRLVQHHIFIPAGAGGNREELGLVKDGGGFHLVGDILQLLVIQRGGHPES